MPPALATVDTVTDLAAFYAEPPEGVRANMIFSADGAAAFAGRAGPLSNAVDQQLLRILRGFADVVLVGAGTARAENYGPVRLSEERRAQRCAEGRSDTPPIAVVTRSGNLPSRLADNPDQPPILVTCGHPRSVEDHRADPDRRVFHAGADSVDVGAAVRMLSAAGMPRILCEGGPTLLDELVEKDVLDELCVTLAPKLAASQPVRDSVLASAMPAPRDMRLQHAVTHGDYLFLKYRR
ncbi:pyrimidine reductase family protein [Mycobacterium sp. AMU20-3851]|uniref:pyrimidine reductase family protein n=1 Tax=Mycobacterium sp. AMU20-3851 TaxID=3122055 RepID=UPI003754F4C4